MNLPEPTCTWGYPEDQLRELLGESYERFAQWVHGQTGGVCDGVRWNGYTYVPTGCGPHGVVVYPHDLRNFLEGGRVVD